MPIAILLSGSIIARSRFFLGFERQSDVFENLPGSFIPPFMDDFHDAGKAFGGSSMGALSMSANGSLCFLMRAARFAEVSNATICGLQVVCAGRRKTFCSPHVPGFIGADVSTPEQMLARWDRYVEDGVYFKADTIEDLASALGLDPGALKETVEECNAMCEVGEDAEYHKRADLMFPLKAPFYGFKCGVCVLTVHGGLHVDEDSRVLDAEGKPIDGLFAVGLAGGDFWVNSYMTRYVCIRYGRNLTTGYLVGRLLAGKE